MIKEKKQQQQPNGNKCQHLSSACDSFVLLSVKPAALPDGEKWKLICMRVKMTSVAKLAMAAAL